MSKSHLHALLTPAQGEADPPPEAPTLPHMPQRHAPLRASQPPQAPSATAISAAPPRMQRVDELAHYERLLLLQGPNGPFFRRLTLRLRSLGATVTRVNFNAGDDLFHPRHDAVCYAGSHADWPAFLEQLLRERDIRAIVLFGQERAPHVAALEAGQRLGIPVVVFEEGYVRPCWVTMEVGGVNARSALVDSPIPDSLSPGHAQMKQREQFRWAFWAMAFYTGCYGLWGSLLRARYPLYQHHKPLQCRQGLYWMRATLRKLLYSLTQRRERQALVDPQGPSYFLVPLQIALDSQILHHSAWAGNEPFIESVLRSFAASGEASDHLVFKHHPLEMGHAHYGRQIRRLAAELGMAGRVHYIHGGHLPSMLARARGVVLVNSTVGLQAMHHGTPVYATGQAVYAKPGLVHAGPLEEFWRAPQAPDADLVQRFVNHVIVSTQVNASFYAPDGTWSWPASKDAQHRAAVQVRLRPAPKAAAAEPAWLTKARLGSARPSASSSAPAAARPQDPPLQRDATLLALTDLP